jgi:hypothetical protein
MSVAGKKHDDWVARTICDFGQQGRREVLRHHYSIEAALNCFKEICKIYGKKPERCWQETREGEVINDNK